jgi:insertion element IS1 protein InsB
MRIPPGYRCRATRSDFWLAYEGVLPKRTHRLCGKAEGETNHVERFNCTLRQRLGRFVRKTLSFSKCERMHEVALRLFIHEYNQQPII